MEIILLIILIAGTCDSDDVALFCEDDCAGAGGEGGSGGGAGGAGGANSASTSGGAVEGDGGAPCEPSNATCGEATCGEAPDGCGGETTCGSCADGELCVRGSCCARSCPVGKCGRLPDGCEHVMDCACAEGQACSQGNCCDRLACEPGMCGAHDDRCGGEVDCGGCGDGSEWITCGATGRCECTPLAQFPEAAEEEELCVRTWRRHAYACGSPGAPEHGDAPEGCMDMALEAWPGGPRLWCCE